MKMPTSALNRVVSRIKVLGQLDIADRLHPQDGGARIRVEEATLDLRISTVPTRDSEKAVIRILNPMAMQSLDDLTLPKQELKRLRQLFAHRDGMVLVAGPTGSGKTTTVYSGIRELATGRINIMSVEEPVEYDLPGVTQIQVDPRRGVTFASALRAILRPDPDVVFVGEIRDAETARIALQASMTGHLVVATLHTNDSVSTIPRLLDFGLERSVLANTFRGAVAQRLLRRRCQNCMGALYTLGTPGRESPSRSPSGAIPTLSGCQHCGLTGYRGRVAVVEVLVSSPKLERLISEGAPAAELEHAALDSGMRSMLEIARARVADEETTEEEVSRVIGDESEHGPRVAEGTAGQKVLIVEDDAVNRLVVRRLLGKNAFTVAEAVDGIEALKHLESPFDYGLVILDLDMPRMGGEAVLKAVKRSPATAWLPVVVLNRLGRRAFGVATHRPRRGRLHKEAGGIDFLPCPGESGDASCEIVSASAESPLASVETGTTMGFHSSREVVETGVLVRPPGRFRRRYELRWLTNFVEDRDDERQ